MREIRAVFRGTEFHRALAKDQLNPLGGYDEKSAGSNIRLKKTAVLLGHESLDTTRIYTQPSEADLQAATEKVAWQEK